MPYEDVHATGVCIYYAGRSWRCIAFAAYDTFYIAGCGLFSRSSEKWHNWLLGNKYFGPCIHRWENQRCVNCKTKIFSLVSMAIMGGASLGFANHGIVFKSAAAALMLVGALCIIRISTCATSTEFSKSNKNAVV